MIVRQQNNEMNVSRAGRDGSLRSAVFNHGSRYFDVMRTNRRDTDSKAD